MLVRLKFVASDGMMQSKIVCLRDVQDFDVVRSIVLNVSFLFVPVQFHAFDVPSPNQYCPTVLRE